MSHIFENKDGWGGHILAENVVNRRGRLDGQE